MNFQRYKRKAEEEEEKNKRQLKICNKQKTSSQFSDVSLNVTVRVKEANKQKPKKR